MTVAEKFYTDLHKMIKYERANTGSSFDAHTLCEKIATSFSNNNRGMGELPAAIAHYWISQYIDNAQDPSTEPSDNSLVALTAFQAFLDNSSEYTEVLTDTDWKELASMVNCEAETLPLDMLTTLMSTLMEKNAL
ncbi:MAG: hypothetical protein K6E51_08290 [Treponema sp.]|nr:hypothetical protein [Treponema sp.]